MEEGIKRMVTAIVAILKEEEGVNPLMYVDILTTLLDMATSQETKIFILDTLKKCLI